MPRPRTASATTTSSIHARRAVGMRNSTDVKVQRVPPAATGSRAKSTVLCGAAMISFSASRVRGTADDESWGKRRANASTTSEVAASAMLISTGLSDFAIDTTRRAPRLRQGDVVVLADALQDQEDRRALAAVGDQMRAASSHRVGLARRQAHFLLRIAQEESYAALEDRKSTRLNSS